MLAVCVPDLSAVTAGFAVSVPVSRVLADCTLFDSTMHRCAEVRVFFSGLTWAMPPPCCVGDRTAVGQPRQVSSPLRIRIKATIAMDNHSLQSLISMILNMRHLLYDSFGFIFKTSSAWHQMRNHQTVE
jgi:hypothetical protein